MSYIARFFKSPTEVKRYTIDYVDWLGDTEIITSDLYSVSGLSIVSHAISSDGKSISFFVSGGAIDNTYHLDVVVNTSAGQTKEVAVQFNVQDV